MSKDDISITEQEISQRTNTAKGTTDLRAECFCQSTLPKQARNKLSFWALAKKQRGAKSGKVFVKLLRCWYHEKRRICGSTHRPNNGLIWFHLINLIWLCPPQGRHKFEFITMEKPRRLTTLCGDKVRVWLKKDCVTYLQVGASLGQIGWKRNNWSFFFSSCNWGQNNANDVIKISFRAAKHQKYLHSKSSFLPKILSFGQWGRL